MAVDPPVKERSITIGDWQDTGDLFEIIAAESYTGNIIAIFFILQVS